MGENEINNEIFGEEHYEKMDIIDSKSTFIV